MTLELRRPDGRHLQHHQQCSPPLVRRADGTLTQRLIIRRALR